jgi:hypothetical protein
MRKSPPDGEEFGDERVGNSGVVCREVTVLVNGHHCLIGFESLQVISDHVMRKVILVQHKSTLLLITIRI